MNTGDTLIRDTDGKRFRVVELAHWSEVVADDGERIPVKWIGDNKYVAPKGHTL